MVTKKRPQILYRLSKDGIFLYLHVPDTDTEKDSMLMFNRLMADFGFPDPKAIFNKRLGVAVLPVSVWIQVGDKMKRVVLLDEVRIYFQTIPILDADWYGRRF